MSTTTSTGIADGLAAFLSNFQGRAVTVSGVAPSSAGARRANVRFDAHDGYPGGCCGSSTARESESGSPSSSVKRSGILHAVDPAAAPPDLADDHSADPSEAALLAAEAAVAELAPARPAFALGLCWLERHRPDPPDRTTIVHTDVRNGNIIVGPDGLRAVLDWEGAQGSGDPMQDTAWPSLRMWRFREDEREISGFAGRAPFVLGYERAGGTFDHDRFRWWKVLGTLRWGLGLAGQTAAHLDGRFTSVIMAASGRRVPALEWDLLMLLRPSGPY